MLVGGKTPATDTYTVDVASDLKKVGAVRIDVLTDSTLPANGPGRAGGGNFVLSRVGVDVGGAKSLPVGKRVRISLPGRQKILSLAEVQVFVGGKNVAPQGSAAQVSTAYEGEAKRAIDGNTNGDYFGANSTTHTVQQDDPWWELTLPKAAAIEKIVIWNRTDGAVGARLADFNVAIVDEAGNQVWWTKVAKAPSPSVTLATDGGKTPKFVSAVASVEQDGFPAASVIDNTDVKNKGWAIGGGVSQPQWIVLTAAAPFAVRDDGTITLTLDQLSVHGEHTIGAFRVSFTDQASAPGSIPPKVAAILRIEAGKRTAAQRDELAAYYRSIAPETKVFREKIEAKRKEVASIKPVTSPIMRELAENKRRKTSILLRGNFLTKGEAVTEATPAVFHAPPADRKLDRLALARWLVSPENPLTARVVVNRYWEQFFGTGIVETSEDFGVRSKPPTHPELLDWLAVEFASDWDVKRLHKLIVTSQTYRQSAKATPEMLAKDPNNIWLARGPRLRATAETVRDQTLFAAGMLSEKMYGPPVRPLRPKLGLASAFSGSTDWEPSPGEDRYRRAMYTEWRRTTPYPSMMTFDASNRNVCTLKRPRTNTPLQALVTLNDPVYVEAAQALGRRMLKDGGATDSDRLRYGFRLVLTRPPTEAEVARLVSLLENAKAKYADDKKAAEQMAGAVPAGVDAATAAAYTVAANVLLNLDEAVHKR